MKQAMRITAKKINTCAICFMIIYVLGYGYIEYNILWNAVLLGFWVAVTFMNGCFKRIKRCDFVYLGAIAILLFMSVAVSGTLEGLFANTRRFLYPLCSLGMFATISEVDGDNVVVLLKKLVIFLNIVLVVNLVVVFIQTTTGNGFMIKNTWLQRNSYYEDNCAGLFGYCGTPILAAYSCFVMVLDLCYAKKEMSSQSAKNIFYIYIIATQCVMAICATMNDLNAYFFELIIFVILYFGASGMEIKNKIRRLRKYLMYICGVLALMVGSYCVPAINEYMNETFFLRVYNIFAYNKTGATGSAERLAILQYALSEPSTYLFGKGWGKYELQENLFGFRHFGLSSIGAYVLIGGLWFFLTVLLYYTYVMYKITNGKRNRSVGVYIVSLLVVLFYTIYTSVFNESRIVILLALTAFCLRMLLNDTDEVICQ